MGLELGPPWIVLAAKGSDPDAAVLFRDNFTGAGLERIIRAKKHQPNTFAAAMDKYGRFALEEDGRIFDPIAATAGRNTTMAERGHRAQIMAKKLFRAMGSPTREQLANSPKRSRTPGLVALGVLLALWALSQSGGNAP